MSSWNIWISRQQKLVDSIECTLQLFLILKKFLVVLVDRDYGG